MYVCRYWTDNGACYYYDTGNYSNYEEVLDAVIAQANQANIPFRYLQVPAYLRTCKVQVVAVCSHLAL